MKRIVFLAMLLPLAGCSSIPDFDDVAGLVGLGSDSSDTIAAHEECAALDGAIAANISSSPQAREEELKYADAFRAQATNRLNQAVKLRMEDDDLSRSEAFQESSARVRKLTSGKAVFINDRLLVDNTGVLDNPWVNDQRLACQETPS